MHTLICLFIIFSLIISPVAHASEGVPFYLKNLGDPLPERRGNPKNNLYVPGRNHYADWVVKRVESVSRDLEDRYNLLDQLKDSKDPKDKIERNWVLRQISKKIDYLDWLNVKFFESTGSTIADAGFQFKYMPKNLETIAEQSKAKKNTTTALNESAPAKKTKKEKKQETIAKNELKALIREIQSLEVKEREQTSVPVSTEPAIEEKGLISKAEESKKEDEPILSEETASVKETKEEKKEVQAKSKKEKKNKKKKSKKEKKSSPEKTTVTTNLPAREDYKELTEKKDEELKVLTEVKVLKETKVEIVDSILQELHKDDKDALKQIEEARKNEKTQKEKSSPIQEAKKEISEQSVVPSKVEIKEDKKESKDSNKETNKDEISGETVEMELLLETVILPAPVKEEKKELPKEEPKVPARKTERELLIEKIEKEARELEALMDQKKRQIKIEFPKPEVKQPEPVVVPEPEPYRPTGEIVEEGEIQEATGPSF